VFEDGLYMSHGVDGTVLVVIAQDNRKTLWVRSFAATEYVLGVLDEEVLSDHDRSAMASHLSAKKGFHTKSYNEPEGGLKDCAFQKYVLET
jgi:hypothetical protein